MFIKLLAFITIFLFEQTVSQGCLPIISSNGSAPTLPDLQSNIVNLAFSGNKTRQNLYNVTLKNTYNMQTGYELIAGIDYIESYFDPAALDFSVRAIPQPSYFTLYIVISDTSNWTKMHIHYMVSAREQIRVGSFIPNTPDLLDFSRTVVTTASNINQNAANVNSAQPANVTVNWRIVNVTFPFGDIRKWNATSKYPVARAYMTGIKYQDRFIDLQILFSIVNTTANTINVTLNISNQKYSIESLYIGYVIYSQVNTVLSISVVQSVATFFDRSLNNLVDNQFIGIIKLNSKRLSSFFNAGAKRRLLAISDVLGAGALQYDKVELLSFIQSFQSEGLSIQMVSTAEPSTGGIALSKVGFPIIKQGTGSNPGNVECTTYLGCQRAGGVIATDQYPPKCVMCKPNSEYNPTSGVCECFKDFFRDDQQACTSLSTMCQPNQLYLDGNCYILSSQVINNACKSNQVFNVTSKQCTCRPGLISYTTASGVRKCAAQCTNSFIFDVFLQKCTCPTGFLDSKGNCVYCQGNLSKWNPTKKQCQCSAGSTMYLGQCYQCGNDATYDPVDKKCKCNAGMTGNGIFCRKALPTLPNGFTIITTNTSNLPKNN